MDPGNGRFEDVPETATQKELMGDHYFSVGEELVIKGSKFRVKSIKPKELRLKLLKRNG